MLDNGLQALLISDYSGPAASEDDDSDAEEEEEEEDDESGDETEDESEEDDDIEEGSDEDDDEGKKKKGNAEKQVLSDQYHEYQYHQMYPFCPLSDWTSLWSVCSLQQRFVLEWAVSAIPVTSPASLTFWSTVSINHRGAGCSSEQESFPSSSVKG